MDSPKKLKIKDFTYSLPDERIATYPLEKRDSSKLLVYKNGTISESVFGKIDELFNEGDLFIFNETRVIHARLVFHKETGSRIEIFCLEPHSIKEPAEAFAAKNKVEWICLVGNAKRWKNETLKKKLKIDGNEVRISVEKLDKVNDSFVIKFSWEGNYSFAEIIHQAGLLPLPPYMNRDADEEDEVRYQTVYAKKQGSVATPTAGLHFTPEVFGKLKTKKIETDFLTLHVGAGTFKPVKAETMEQHEMHEERIYVSQELIEKIISKLGKNRIVAVGTTSLRTLESLYWFGLKLLNGYEGDELFVDQWKPYEESSAQCSVLGALQAIVDMMKKKDISMLSGSTKIMIAPPYQFKIADALITNFHQPESTLLLLVAAFTGNDWENIYEYAIATNFRFLSYGDSSVLFRN